MLLHLLINWSKGDIIRAICLVAVLWMVFVFLIIGVWQIFRRASDKAFQKRFGITVPSPRENRRQRKRFGRPVDLPPFKERRR